MSDEEEPPPWRASGVRGIIPPGRKLPKNKDLGPSETAAPWHASGVQGIRLAKSQDAEDVEARWKINRGAKNRKQAPARRAAPIKADKPKSAAGTNKGIKSLLDEIASFFRENLPSEDCAEGLSKLVGQSHAPYEIIMGFTVLSAIVGQDSELRNRYAWALERGARAFFNLAMRIDKSTKAPRGLAPQRLDPLFYDLPATAFQLPHAFATDAYLQILELVQNDIPYNRRLIQLGEKLYSTHIEGHRYGDQALTELFPWVPPDWAPETK